MERSFLKYLLLSSAAWLFAGAAPAQYAFSRVDSVYRAVYRDDSLRFCDYIFIARFNECLLISGRKRRYCGDNLVKYVKGKIGDKTRTLIITTDSLNPYVKKVRQPNVIMRYMPRDQMEKNGLFSYYPVEINKRRKIKKLK